MDQLETIVELSNRLRQAENTAKYLQQVLAGVLEQLVSMGEDVVPFKPSPAALRIVPTDDGWFVVALAETVPSEPQNQPEASEPQLAKVLAFPPEKTKPKPRKLPPKA